jgi:hypothetical protein
MEVEKWAKKSKKELENRVQRVERKETSGRITAGRTMG